MEQSQILETFKKTNALLEGHFLLTSGKHSNQYFQCAQVLQHPEPLKNICEIIANHFIREEIDTVISPAIGGIVEQMRSLATKPIGNPPRPAPPLDDEAEQILDALNEEEQAVQQKVKRNIGKGKKITIEKDW